MTISTNTTRHEKNLQGIHGTPEHVIINTRRCPEFHPRARICHSQYTLHPYFISAPSQRAATNPCLNPPTSPIPLFLLVQNLSPQYMVPPSFIPNFSLLTSGTHCGHFVSSFRRLPCFCSSVCTISVIHGVEGWRKTATLPLQNPWKYTERKPKDKNEGGLGTRLPILISAPNRRAVTNPCLNPPAFPIPLSLLAQNLSSQCTVPRDSTLHKHDNRFCSH